MRDPARIPATLAAVQALWEREPDQRLGQLIDSLAVHAASTEQHSHAGVSSQAHFMVEDDVLEAEARAVLERGWWKWRTVQEIADEAAERRRQAQEEG